VAWEDPLLERIGVAARSAYVEEFWLPVLGPSACLLLRRAAQLLAASPDGLAVPADDLARALGLGGTGGRHAPFPRAIARCVRFGMARRPLPDTVAFRRMVGPLPLRLVTRLPPTLQDAHERWLAARAAPDAEGGGQPPAAATVSS
jgi:hypothetical protein